MAEPMKDYSDYGFEPCDFDPDICDRCGQAKPLYFGDASYWDSREGTYLCGECLDKRIEADKRYSEAMERVLDEEEASDAKRS